MTRATQITAPCTHHGEGPVWDAPGGRLLCVDMLAGAVVELQDGGTTRRHEIDTVVAVVRPRRDGGFVLALEHGFALAASDLTVVSRYPDVIGDPGVRLNEGGCDPQGRFYCGSMAYDTTPGAGSLYRLDPGGRVSTVLTGVTISNGLQWSADGGTVFYNDTATGRVDRFDFDAGAGTLSGRRPFAAFDPAGGAPDGMAIDDKDGLWVALWGGGAVVRLDAGGAVTERFELPVPLVTACAFGGADRSTLFITTSRQGLDPAEHPAAGALFAVETGGTGAPVHAFAG